MPGYSGMPLHKKLGISDGATVGALLDERPGVIGDLPTNVTVKRHARGRADAVVTFLTERRELEERIAVLGRMIFAAGGLWVAWSKRTSGLATSLAESVVREVALPLGLVDNTVCAIDDPWSGLRVVWRRERRAEHDERQPENAGPYFHYSVVPFRSH